MRPDLGVDVSTGTPFAWTDRYGEGPGLASGDRLGAPVRARVTQCALSRVCGVCAEPLGRPIAFLGTEEEIGRNRYHAPPMHVDCATRLQESPLADPTWRLMTTAAFEFVRPGRDEPETESVFCPLSLL